MGLIQTSDLRIFDGLSIVHIDGFEPEKTYVEGTDNYGNTYSVETTEPDPIGSANWLCERYGMAGDFDKDCSGILWTDYDHPGKWRFSALVADGEVDELKDFAREAGYEVVKVEPITEPTTYGDGGGGTVTILKHPDGWVVLQ